MLTRLIEIKQSELNPTLRALSDAGATTEDADWIRRGKNAARMVEFLHKEQGFFDENPFAMTVDDQIAALRLASEEEGWGLDEEIFVNLGDTAPEWPEGRREAFRSFRIRFGEGAEGVQKTFEAHATRIKRVFGEEGFYRWEKLRSDSEYLWLLSGSDTHKPCVEWCIIDLSANRKRKSIKAVQGDDSLADEGLVLAWLFPDRVRAIDYDKLSAWFLAGYELLVPEHSDEPWQFVPFVRWRGDRVELYAVWSSNDHSSYSVPVLRE